MPYKPITIYTPSGAVPHITAEDDAFIHDAMLDGRSGILGSLICEKVDNNTIRLSGGGVTNRGYVMYIPQSGTHLLTLSNGAQGIRRNDLVVAEFTKKGGEYADEHIFKIVEGIAAALADDPELETSDLATSGDVNQVALFRLKLNGLELESIEQIAANAGDIPLAQTSLTCTGNAATATALETQRSITVDGDAQGTVSFDGSNDVTMELSVSKLDGKTIYVQQNAPSSPAEGDIWLW